MLVPYSKMIRNPIFSAKNQTKVGEVLDIVLKKNSFSVAGFAVKTCNRIIRRQKVLSLTDIIDIDKDVIIVAAAEAIINPSEATRIEEAIKQGYLGIGQRVITESGKRIGKVFDYLLLLPSLEIAKIYVRGLFAERIIPSSEIKAFKNKNIVIKDDYNFGALKNPSLSPSAEII